MVGGGRDFSGMRVQEELHTRFQLPAPPPSSATNVQPRDVVALISRLLTSNPDTAALPRTQPSSSARAPTTDSPAPLPPATLVVRTSPTAARVEAAGRRPSPLARDAAGSRQSMGSVPYHVAESPTATLNLDVMHRGLEDLTVGGCNVLVVRVGETFVFRTARWRRRQVVNKCAGKGGVSSAK
jgi:hypothetical protein